MGRLRATTVTLGQIVQEVWRRALQLYLRLRQPRGAGAAASAIRRQYVFGAVGRKTFDQAIRGRLRRSRRT